MKLKKKHEVDYIFEYFEAQFEYSVHKKTPPSPAEPKYRILFSRGEGARLSEMLKSSDIQCQKFVASVDCETSSNFWTEQEHYWSVTSVLLK